MNALYDTIGINYAQLRRPDPRIAQVIHAALVDARSVLNVGAGAGSYEPTDRTVTAVEPSLEMIKQRRPGSAQVIQAEAEALPFPDGSFDASMALLTVHHWKDQARGAKEMRRVTRGPIVLFTYDPAFRGFWLTDYLPWLITLDEAQMPAMATYPKWFGSKIEVRPVPVPYDCSDGFLCAYWRRPAAYLDPRVRSAISSFWRGHDITGPLAQLKRDLASGAWEQRYGHLLNATELDLGYRIVIAS